MSVIKSESLSELFARAPVSTERGEVDDRGRIKLSRKFAPQTSWLQVPGEVLIVLEPNNRFKVVAHDGHLAQVVADDFRKAVEHEEWDAAHRIQEVYFPAIITKDRRISLGEAVLMHMGFEYGEKAAVSILYQPGSIAVGPLEARKPDLAMVEHHEKSLTESTEEEDQNDETTDTEFATVVGLKQS